MLSGQHATSRVAFVHQDLKAITNSTTPNTVNTKPHTNGHLIKDQQCPIEPNGRTTASMTKQLTTTIATISNSQLAPTTISPTATSAGTTNAVTPTTSATEQPPVPPPLPPPLTPTPTLGRQTKTAGQLPAITTTAPSPPQVQQQQQLKPPSTTTNLGQSRTPSSSNDASGRSAALERAYVHDVYENCEEPTGSIRPRVAQFLSNLDPGSIVCDVGCGSGRYLTQCNPAICTVGVDRCYRLSKVARSQGGEVALCDNLELPFRDESFDAVLSLAVVHHFATTERRIRALRELSRILRIGGRVVITVWALEQRHRRFESQDVLIPWQPPKNRNFNCSDEEDEDDFLPPYHAYTEDSTNSSRSAGDGDSSSLSSSSPGESCYSFVRRAIQKLAGGRKHPWFLDSWNSKDTKNDSSLDYEDAKDLPIELRRLEDFEDFNEPPLSAGLKSRSLGSILNPPPRQIVRSRSSVPSLGGVGHTNMPTTGIHDHNAAAAVSAGVAVVSAAAPVNGAAASGTASLGRRPKLIKQKQSLCDEDYQLPDCAAGTAPFHMISSYNSSTNSVNSSLGSRASSGGTAYYYRGDASGNQHFGMPLSSAQHQAKSPLSARQMAQASVFLRKQSSLNEELMAGNRIREKERVRKRIQKQISLNEAFLCRSQLFSKRLQVIREGVTSKIKSSTGSLERVTKTGLTKIMENFKGSQAEGMDGSGGGVLPSGADSKSSPAQCNSVSSTETAQGPQTNNHQTQHQVPQTQCLQHQHHHHHHHQQQQQQQQGVGLFQSHFSYLLHKQRSPSSVESGPVYYCNKADCATTTGCYCQAYHNDCGKCSGCLAASAVESDETKARRHSRESGSDSSKDSLQSDTSIESEDSFASVIFIPKPEQHQQQLNYQQQHSQNSNSSSSNSSSSNGHHQHQLQQQMYGKTNTASMNGFGPHQGQQQHQQSGAGQQHYQHQRGSSVPTSPLIMPCPPTPAHSPAAAQAAVTSPPQTVAAVTAAMAILTPPFKGVNRANGENTHANGKLANDTKNRFNFDVAHIKQQQTEEEKEKAEQKRLFVEKEQKLKQELEVKKPAAKEPNKPTEKAEVRVELPVKITRQTIKDLPPIPKFRKQQSLPLHRQNFPIVRRSSASANSAIPSIPKLMSLELFNPLTDDLDSDSSEPSSPDSIDSVISAPKSVQSLCKEDDSEPAKTDNSDVANHEDLHELIKVQQRQYHNGELKINPSAPNDIILNDDSANILPSKVHNSNSSVAAMQRGQKQQDCAEFAEKLSAQLMREIEDKNNRIECRSLDGISDIGEYLDDPLLVGHKKRNQGEQRDLTALRDELRERRLMLANLSTQPSLQQSPTNSSSTSSRSFTIHEEDEEEDEEENERSYTLQLYENCKVSKFDYKRNRQYNLHPETAYLLQDDGDSSIRDDDDMDDFEHDVILEEDEEALEAERKQEQLHNANKCDSVEVQDAKDSENPTQSKQPQEDLPPEQQQSQQVQRRSTESWEHSNSSNSLDSPSQGGGSSTHHRYYHVFREGELDALINHHVTSLHIVSSYYERASWCVVAEKVQVWTI